MTTRLARPALLALLGLAAACPAQDQAVPAAPAPATPAPVPPDPAAAKVIQDAAAAAKALTSISYTTTFSGDLMGLKQKGKADVLMLRDAEHGGRWLKRWTGTHEMVSMEQTQIQAADQGDTITYINFPLKEYHKELAKYANPRGTETLVYVWIPEIAGEGDHLNRLPYEKYLEAPGGLTPGAPKGVVSKDAAVGPVDSVGGVTCDVVTADFGPNQTMRSWWFSQEDHLPRKLVWTFKDAGTWTWELSDVKVNPEIAPAMFDLPTPEGFKRFDPPPPVSPTTAAPTGATVTDGGLQTSLAGARVTGLIPGSLAPDFTLPMVTLDSSGPGVVPVKGKSFTLSAERSSVIVLDFFGSWNAQSKSAAPEMARMAAALRGKPVKIISLAVRERDEAKPIEFLSQTPYATALLPAADEVAKLYKARVIPTYFVIGLEGEVVYTNSTYGRDVTVKEVQDVIERYLQSRRPAKAAEGGEGEDAGDTAK